MAGNYYLHGGRIVYLAMTTGVTALMKKNRSQNVLDSIYLFSGAYFILVYKLKHM
jgi:hypothetical protein